MDGTRRLPISPLIDTYLVPEAPQGARSDPTPPLATSSAIGHRPHNPDGTVTFGFAHPPGVEVMVGQTDFLGRLIERKQPLPIDFYESWHAQNTQKHDVGRKLTRVLHAPTSEYSAVSRWAVGRQADHLCGNVFALPPVWIECSAHARTQPLLPLILTLHAVTRCIREATGLRLQLPRPTTDTAPHRNGTACYLSRWQMHRHPRHHRTGIPGRPRRAA